MKIRYSLRKPTKHYLANVIIEEASTYKSGMLSFGKMIFNIFKRSFFTKRAGFANYIKDNKEDILLSLKNKEAMEYKIFKREFDRTLKEVRLENKEC